MRLARHLQHTPSIFQEINQSCKNKITKTTLTANIGIIQAVNDIAQSNSASLLSICLFPQHTHTSGWQNPNQIHNFTDRDFQIEQNSKYRRDINKCTAILCFAQLCTALHRHSYFSRYPRNLYKQKVILLLVSINRQYLKSPMKTRTIGRMLALLAGTSQCTYPKIIIQ